MAKKNKAFMQKVVTLGLAATMAAAPAYTAAIPVFAEENVDLIEIVESTEEVVKPVEEGNGGTPESAPSSIADLIDNQKHTLSDAAVYQIRIGYEFDDGSFDEWARGTGYLIAEKYILTSQTLADTSIKSSLFSKIQTDRSDIYKTVGISLSDEKTTEDHLKIYVTDNSGKKVEVGSPVYKNGMGIIPLNKAASTSYCIFAGDSKIDFQDGQEVNLKFAGKKDDTCDVQTVKGKVYIPAETETVNSSAFYFKADTTNGNPLGSPVYDANGDIIGMVSSIGKDDSLTALNIDALETFIASNGISYKTRTQVQEEQEAAEKEQAEKDAQDASNSVVKTDKLEKAIEEAKAVDKEAFTEESMEALEVAVKDAEKILKDNKKTQAQVDTATENINTAMENLKESGIVARILDFVLNNKIVVYAGVAVIAIIGVGVYLAKSLRKINRNKKAAEEAQEAHAINNDESDMLRNMEAADLADKDEEENIDIEHPRHPSKEEYLKQVVKSREEEEAAKQKDMDFDDMPGIVGGSSSKVDESEDLDDAFDFDDGDMDMTVRHKPKSEAIHAAQKPEGLVYADESDGEVSVLDDDDEGSEDTTVLSNAYLIRVETGRKIPITKNDFLIGKEKKKVDYCISGNSSVSRVHARIFYDDKGYCVEDHKSVNFTYVNGQQIPEYRAVRIKDNDLLRFSDVEFVFRTNK